MSKLPTNIKTQSLDLTNTQINPATEETLQKIITAIANKQWISSVVTCDSQAAEDAAIAAAAPYPIIVVRTDILPGLSTKTLSGKGNILNTAKQIQTGKANIAAQSSTIQVQSGKARVQKTNTQSEAGVARISKANIQTQPGKANITTDTITKQYQSGKANIQNTTTQVESGKARITVNTVKIESGKSNIQKTALQTQQGKSNIQKTALQTQQGKSRITANTLKTQNGKANIASSGSTNTYSENFDAATLGVTSYTNGLYKWLAVGGSDGSYVKNYAVHSGTKSWALEGPPNDGSSGVTLALAAGGNITLRAGNITYWAERLNDGGDSAYEMNNILIIDGVRKTASLIAGSSANGSWGQYSVAVTAGTHSITFSNTFPSSGNGGTTQIDDVIIPIP